MVLHRKLKKGIALLLASMVMCMNVIVLEAKDYKGHWAQEAISEWVSLGIVRGYEDGTIRPSKPMTRAELAGFLSRVFKLNYKNESINYKDVKENAWYNQAVELVMSAGIMNDYGNEFRPNQLATREEAAYAFAHAYHLSGENAKTFIDSHLISDWAQEEVEALIAGGYLKGKTDGRLDPQGALTRAEFITMLDRLTEKLYQNAGTYTGNINGNVAINASDITLKDMTISGNLYITEGVGEGDVTLENVKVDGDVIVEGGGENTVEINQSTLKNIYVEKASGAVRIALDQTSKVENIKVKSEIQLEGNIGHLEVATQEEVRLVGVSVKSVQISSTGGKVSVDETSIIEELVVDATANITGNGKVNKAFINADHVVIEGLKLATNEVVINSSVQVPPVINTNPGETPEDSEEQEKPVESIRLSHENMDLLLGCEALLKAEVFPIDATNKTIKWHSSNPEIVNVDDSGKVVAKGIGEAIITASTPNDEVSATCRIRVDGHVLKGKVTVEHNAIEGVEVLLYSEKNQFKTPITSVRSNALGEYQFSDLPKGNYRIKAFYEDETSEYLAPTCEVLIKEASQEIDIKCEKVTSLIVEVVDSETKKEVLYAHVLVEGKDAQGNKWNQLKETDGAGCVKFILPNDIQEEITYTVKKDGYEEITLTHTLEPLAKNILETPFKKEVEPVYPEYIEPYAETEGVNKSGLGDTIYEVLKKAGWRVESETQLSTNSRRLKFENMNGKDGIDVKIIYDTSGPDHEIKDYDILLQYMIRKQSGSTEGDLTFEQLKRVIGNGSGTHQDGNRTIQVTYDGKPDGIVEIVFSNYVQ